MSADWSLDVAISRDDAIARIAAAINQRPKRAFGVIKTQKEFVGAVSGEYFEIWERSQRAVHAVGRVRPSSGGARIEMRFLIPPITRGLLVAFFTLYVIAAGSIAVGASDATRAVVNGLIGAVGGVVLVALFRLGSRQQRAELRAFAERLFGDVRRS